MPPTKKKPSLSVETSLQASQKFQEFVGEIREKKGNWNKRDLKRLAKTLTELRKGFGSTPVEKVLKDLSIPDKKIAALLGLGAEFSEDEEMYQEILEIIVLQKGEDCGLMAVQFLKTDVGYEFLHSKKSTTLEKFLRSKGEQYEKDALPILEKFFGGAFGLDLTYDILKSIKTEEVACLTTYALTGRSDKDVQDFLKENPKASQEEVFKHVRKKAFEADQTFKMVNAHNNLLVEGEFLNETREEGSRRGASRVDTAMCSYPEEDGRVSHFFITNATSTKDLSDQGNVFAQYFVAALKYIRTETVNGAPNPLFGAQLHAIYFLAGLFPDDAKEIEFQRKQRNLIGYLKESDLSRKEKRDLAQMAFIGLLGNCNTTEEAVILFAHNPIIAGCDTYDLYRSHLEVKEMLANNDLKGATELVQKLASEKIISASQSLAKLLERNKEKFADGSESKQYVDTNETLRFLIINLKNSLDKLNQVFDYKDHKELKEKIFTSVDKLNAFGKTSIKNVFGTPISELIKTNGRFERENFETFNVRDYESLQTDLGSVLANPTYNSQHHVQYRLPNDLSEIDFKLVAQRTRDVLKGSVMDKNPAINIFLSCIDQMNNFLDGGEIDKAKLHKFVTDKVNSGDFTLTTLKSVYVSLNNAMDDLDLLGYKNISQMISKFRFMFISSEGYRKSTKKQKELFEYLSNDIKSSAQKEHTENKKINKVKVR